MMAKSPNLLSAAIVANGVCTSCNKRWTIKLPLPQVTIGSEKTRVIDALNLALYQAIMIFGGNDELLHEEYKILQKEGKVVSQDDLAAHYKDDELQIIPNKSWTRICYNCSIICNRMPKPSMTSGLSLQITSISAQSQDSQSGSTDIKPEPQSQLTFTDSATPPRSLDQKKGAQDAPSHLLPSADYDHPVTSKRSGKPFPIDDLTGMQEEKGSYIDLPPRYPAPPTPPLTPRPRISRSQSSSTIRSNSSAGSSNNTILPSTFSEFAQNAFSPDVSIQMVENELKRRRSQYFALISLPEDPRMTVPFLLLYWVPTHGACVKRLVHHTNEGEYFIHEQSKFRNLKQLFEHYREHPVKEGVLLVNMLIAKTRTFR